MNTAEKPRLIVVAGPNGAGKTSITEQLLRHEWMQGCVCVNPDFLARDEFGDWNAPDAISRPPTRSIANCAVAARIADRAYIYDNSVEDESARLLFRTQDGKLIKSYENTNPWALDIFGELEL